MSTSGPNFTTSTQKSSEEEAASDTPQKYLTGGILKIYVSRKRKLFEVHKILLMAKSGYFRRMLSNSDWEETKTGELYWTDDDETTGSVEIMMSWLYNSKLKFTVQKTVQSFRAFDMINCYSIAHRRDMPAFKNDLMDAYRQYSRNGKSDRPSILSRALEHGLRDTPLYDYMFKALIFSLDKNARYLTDEKAQSSEIRKLFDGESPSLLLDVVEGLLRFKVDRYADPRNSVGCLYHDHSDGSKCYSV